MSNPAMILKTPLSLFYCSAFLKSQMFLMPILYLFYLSNGLTTADYFLFQGLIVLINVLLQIPAGIIGDKIPRYYILLCSYALFLGRIILWLLFSGPLVVLIGELLYAVSKALFDTIESPFLYDMLKQKQQENKMTQAYSRLNFALSAGMAIAALCGAWLYETLGLTILLSLEFILITTATVMAFKLPYIPPANPDKKASFHWSALKTIWGILNNKSFQPFIFFSALLVAFSHFFFWSFQPIMKQAAVPVGLFGIVIFVNNFMRSTGSLLTQRLLSLISLKTLGRTVLITNSVGLLLGWMAQSFIFGSPTVCLIFLFYLCCCIVLQLMFTIAHISRLQQIAPPTIRTQTAATNMMVARLLTTLVLVTPKYLGDFVSLMSLYAIYAGLFLSVGLYLFHQLSKSQAPA